MRRAMKNIQSFFLEHFALLMVFHDENIICLEFRLRPTIAGLSPLVKGYNESAFISFQCLTASQMPFYLITNSLFFGVICEQYNAHTATRKKHHTTVEV